MNLGLAALALAAAPVQVDHPRTYLLSVGGIALKASESIEAFSIDTWGVDFAAVCRIPAGWRIKAGGGATPDGELSGQGSQGATWLRHGSPVELRAFVLVTLSGPVQRADIRDATGVEPATFGGHATISTEEGTRRARLTYRNVRLTPALHCPVH
jgi:hypothetical protein